LIAKILPLCYDTVWQANRMGKSVSVIIPTYNERDNIAPLVERIDRALASDNYEVVFVDDNSQDGTAAAIDRLSAKYPVKALVRKDERGLATAVIHGINNSEGDTIIVMDADLQHPPEVIPDLLKGIGSGADVAVASRYTEGGGMEEWGLVRRVISRGAIFLCHLLLPATRPVKDPMSGYFAFRRQVVGDAVMKPSGWKILLEILLVGKFQKAVEVPYTFTVRAGGESKLNTRQQIEYLRHLFTLMRRTGELMRFIKFCLVGASGVGVNLGIFWLLTRFGGMGEKDFLALALAIEASIISNFTLNEFFTFRDRRHPGASFLLRLLKFNVICLVGAGIQAGVYALLHHAIGLYDLVSNLIGIIIAMLWNYLLNTWWTWK
jgi:dolichol-phosphate mannosyltransferase